MRFLKTKIMKAQKAVDKSLAPTITPENDMEDISTTTGSPLQKSPTASDANAGVQIANKISKSRQKQSFGQKRQSHKRVPGGNSRATKNVVINFGKAIASFAGSPLANMYLKPMLEKENVTTKEFTDFVGQAKSGIGGIDSFRLLLLIEKGDTDTLAACKRIFAEIGKVFIKYFSVNWITHGRINDKLTHLKYRNRMLRRIENPENFTYVCGSRKQ